MIFKRLRKQLIILVIFFPIFYHFLIVKIETILVPTNSILRYFWLSAIVRRVCSCCYACFQLQTTSHFLDDVSKIISTFLTFLSPAGPPAVFHSCMCLLYEIQANDLLQLFYKRAYIDIACVAGGIVRVCAVEFMCAWIYVGGRFQAAPFPTRANKQKPPATQANIDNVTHDSARHTKLQ